jgi:uncharacterized protein YbaR (Trm112 family)
MDNKLLEILACPICKSPLIHDKNAQELICKVDRLALAMCLFICFEDKQKPCAI